MLASLSFIISLMPLAPVTTREVAIVTRASVGPPFLLKKIVSFSNFQIDTPGFPTRPGHQSQAWRPSASPSQAR